VRGSRAEIDGSNATDTHRSNRRHADADDRMAHGRRERSMQFPLCSAVRARDPRTRRLFRDTEPRAELFQEDRLFPTSHIVREAGFVDRHPARPVHCSSVSQVARYRFERLEGSDSQVIAIMDRLRRCDNGS